MLREALERGEFVITCEFVPGRGREGATVDAALEFAREVVAAGLKVHAVSLTDNPGGNPAIMPDALAPEIRKLGLEALVHFSCRDYNRNAIESRLMALSREDVHDLLVLTGDYPAGGFEGHASGVYDLDAVQALKYIKAMNAGLEVPGGKKGATVRLPATGFFTGAAVSPFKFSEAEVMTQFFKMERKIAAGADFIIPQLGYDMRKFLEVRRYVESRGLRTKLIGNVYVLSLGAAKVMHAGGVPGCVVSDALLNVLEAEAKEPDKGKAKRLERAAKMVAMFKGMGYDGVHIGGFALKYPDFRFIIERAAEWAPRWEACIPDVSFGRPGEFYAFPPPVTYRPGTRDEDPVPRLGKARKSPAYRFSLALHALLFDRRGLGCRLMTRYYRALNEKSWLARLTHFAEFFSKWLIYGCRDCGDCALPDMAYCCPQGRCAKQQRNGPCGGSLNGQCEVYPDGRPCVWTLVYQRRKSDGALDELRSGYIPPRKGELDYTSAWANYYLGRDHSV
jgi:methylenetetrahydrofolate reductase (NADPH)